MDLAKELLADELEALGFWRGEETKRAERLTLGNSSQITFEASEEYQQRMRLLEIEYERRRASIRDRSEVRLAGTELIGGRIVRSLA